MSRTVYRTTRDIVIPAGTRLLEPPVYSSSWATDYDAPVMLDRDHTGRFAVDLKEGLECGLVEEITT